MDAWMDLDLKECRSRGVAPPNDDFEMFLSRIPMKTFVGT